jgi:hypothetical protein
VSEKTQKLTQKLIFQLLSFYGDEARLALLKYLFNSLDTNAASTGTGSNDRALSILASLYFKPFLDKQGSDIILYLTFAKEFLFEVLLNSLKDDQTYILDLTERLQAGLNLLIFLTYRERALLKSGALTSPIITESHYFSERVRKAYLEPLAHTI